MSYRARTTTASQRVPEDALLAAQKFWKFIFEHRDIVVQTTTGPAPLYPPSSIGNCDETPLFYEYPSKRTIESVGAKNIPVMSFGGDKTKCTVLLSALADGTKLPPFVIFQLKTGRVLPRVPPGIHVKCTYQAAGVCDTRTYLEWFEKVWLPYVVRGGGVFAKPKLLFLIADAYRSHYGPEVKKMASENRILLGIVPSGMTKYLQPLDVCIMKPFKDYVKRQYNEWLLRDPDPNDFTARGNRRSPPREILIEWVHNAWEQVSPNLIRKSFLVTGISCSKSGS